METIELQIVFKTGKELSVNIIDAEWVDRLNNKTDTLLVFTDTEGFLYTINIGEILYFRTRRH